MASDQGLAIIQRYGVEFRITLNGSYWKILPICDSQRLPSVSTRIGSSSFQEILLVTLGKYRHPEE